MTWLLYLLGAVAAGAFFTAGYMLGVRHGSIDNDSYWLGFADGETQRRIDERNPSSN